VSASSSPGALAEQAPDADAIDAAAPAAPAARAWQPLAGIAWMALASTLFALMNVLARLASAHAPWAEVAGGRTIVGALIALAFALSRGKSLRVRDRRLAWARSLCGTGALLCVFYTLGAPSIALGDVVTIGATGPIFVALLSPRLLGERPSRSAWVATALAFAGVALVAGPTLHLAGHLAAIAVLGSLFTAFAMIWLRKLGGAGQPESAEAIALHFSSVASAVLLVVALPGWRTPDGPGALYLVAAGVSGGVAQLAMTRAYALDRAARVGAVGYLGVVLSHVLGAAWLGEEPAANQLLGTLLVIAAGLALALEALRDGRASPGDAATS
jgi:drug/metabolite transporter (DMT)-like permease